MACVEQLEYIPGLKNFAGDPDEEVRLCLLDQTRH